MMADADALTATDIASTDVVAPVSLCPKDEVGERRVVLSARQVAAHDCDHRLSIRCATTFAKDVDYQLMCALSTFHHYCVSLQGLLY